MAKQKTETIRQTHFILASPEKVYDAFVDPKKHSAFTGARAVGRAKVGGQFTAWDGYIWGKTVEIIPGKKIIQTWRTSDFAENDLDSLLEIDFCVSLRSFFKNRFITLSLALMNQLFT